MDPHSFLYSAVLLLVVAAVSVTLFRHFGLPLPQATHWVVHEQPARVIAEIGTFLKAQYTPGSPSGRVVKRRCTQWYCSGMMRM